MSTSATASAKNTSRFAGRTHVVWRALHQRIRSVGRRHRAPHPRRILVAHHLLLGDTLALTPLLAKLRQQYPVADIVMMMPVGFSPLYARRPYGVRACGWDPRDPSAASAWTEGDFDLALVPSDNRFSWLAQALGSRWIVAFDGDWPARKNWPVDELRRYPDTPAAWSDLATALVDGPPPRPYSPADWQAPPAEAFERPPPRYAVLHVGASTRLKHWGPSRWQALASWIGAHGIEPVWLAGHGETATVEDCDPGHRFRSFAGELALPQVWNLLSGGALLVAPDTGIAHLGRIVGVPTVTLFGPGSSLLSGAGAFWRDSPYRAVTVDSFPCRDQRIVFRRKIEWVRNCTRSTAECAHPRCMDAISIDAVQRAILDLGVIG